ncbi:MAG: Cof-type HAD-IIB family hydrolase [Lactobacillus sp.]|nr:Cof-type HAD-IIB family hydrolase [Lactobacillus sp.]
MSVKLLAIDLDGTLLTSQQTIDDFTIDTLKEASRKGIKVVLCSGRPLSGILPFAKKLGISGDSEYAIAFNGAVAQSIDGEVIFSHQLKKTDLDNFLRFRKFANCNIDFETTHKFYSPDRDLCLNMLMNAVFTRNELEIRDEYSDDFKFVKCVFCCNSDLDEVEKLWNKLPQWAFDKYEIVRSFYHLAEITVRGASKGHAVSELAERLSIKEDEVAVFGDQGNDLSMFENPNFYKVAMGNAIEQIKDLATVVTADNDHRGVAKAVKELMKNGAR